MDGCNKQTDIHTDNTRSSVSIHRNLSRTWFKQPNDYPENNRGYKHNRHYKYLLAVTLLFANPSYAETVGGVSATANPVANSSGSVTNQAIQVLQGPYITNTYGGGIQCQGPTRNFTPYVTGSVSASKPYEDYYDDPVYDVTDNFGAFDADGNPMGDGILDNPGDISFYKKTRTGQKDNYSLGVGFSMTWSTPTDKKLQDLCKEAATSNIEMMKQLTANKRLDFEIARLKNCGQLMKDGISFHPRSPYYKICADVVVQNVTTVKQHRHSIPSVSVPTSIPVSPHSDDAALLGAPLETRP
ncbi:gp165 [Synechococcus phage S-CAM8]|uniref:Gp165 n=1 Tax=Synechococcus phage S-CAM8 TaxID=754038 RepID=G8EY53_9CAUD|nr:gp165 [Synechococcus phage S-CAM8]